jgi:hypothetical protein
MLGYYQGFPATANEVLSLVGGTSIDEPASKEDILRVRGWRGAFGTSTRSTVDCLWFDRIDERLLVSLRGFGRMFFLGTDANHLLAVTSVRYREDLRDAQRPVRFDSLEAYDPLNGVRTWHSWAELRSHVAATWSCFVVFGFKRTF